MITLRSLVPELLLALCLVALGLPAAAGEIGANDFRISFTGPDGNAAFDARAPAVAYNSTADEYLAVWFGPASLVDPTPRQVFAQRFAGANGAPVGSLILVNDGGASPSGLLRAFEPDVTYNPNANEYLVVWWGTDDSFLQTVAEREILGQRLDAVGNPLGTNDFRISDMGPDDDTAFSAAHPAVVFNAMDDEYLVVWEGVDDATGSTELEIYGQRIDDSGSEVGSNDFRISDMGSAGATAFAAFAPRAAHNPNDDEYLVVWWGDDDSGSLVDQEFEVHGQRLSAAGAEVGTNDLRISQAGADGDPSFLAVSPDVGHHPVTNEYVVVFGSSDTGGSPFHGEIRMQRLSAAGVEIGPDDVPITDSGPQTDPNFGAGTPAIRYDADGDTYLVAYTGFDDTLGVGEGEVFAQQIDGLGNEIGLDDFRLSDLGSEGDPGFAAGAKAVACRSSTRQCLIVFAGDDDTPPLVNNEVEIFGQRWTAAGAAPVPALGGVGLAVLAGLVVIAAVAGARRSVLT